MAEPRRKKQEEYFLNNREAYAALEPSPRTIRLLRLLPGDFSDEIECELSSGSWDMTCYEALSYTWGNKGLQKCIKLDRRDFSAYLLTLGS